MIYVTFLLNAVYKIKARALKHLTSASLFKVNVSNDHILNIYQTTSQIIYTPSVLSSFYRGLNSWRKLLN